ncbi:hypothetical protein F442_21514 [Phytophthora nicotianae P10297]|uniref:Uncharacterized protein n=1 Tax=Phytophthora nicotianae P10297 TaxID=1317064 RepID=W2Y3U4_PHYNI|nr:hypothetical protein F442_21514 [Phytophthora nicotianae P10297]
MVDKHEFWIAKKLVFAINTSQDTTRKETPFTSFTAGTRNPRSGRCLHQLDEDPIDGPLP